jgi:CheY-like chemotaxis protein
MTDPASHPPTTLVVDDEPSVRALTRRVLVREGHQVLEAATGAEARAVVGAHAGVIDLLVADLQLPDVRGAELARELRAARPALRVLVVSGCAEEDASVVDAHFLSKPYTAAGLAAAARRALGAAAA